MSETKHSPEPWRVTGAPRWEVVDADGKAIIRSDVCADWCEFPDEATERRIVAAVNAVTGIPTEALEAGALRDALQALAVLVDEGEPAACQRLALRQARHALRALGRLP